MGEIMVSKSGHLMPPGTFPSDIDFTDEAVGQYDIPVVEIL